MFPFLSVVYFIYYCPFEVSGVCAIGTSYWRYFLVVAVRGTRHFLKILCCEVQKWCCCSSKLQRTNGNKFFSTHPLPPTRYRKQKTFSIYCALFLRHFDFAFCVCCLTSTFFMWLNHSISNFQHKSILKFRNRQTFRLCCFQICQFQHESVCEPRIKTFAAAADHYYFLYWLSCGLELWLKLDHSCPQTDPAADVLKLAIRAVGS